MSKICCDYKVARRGMLTTNFLVIIFSLIFLGVGASSLAYGKAFQEELETYCIQQCATTVLLNIADPVGCSCKTGPGKTLLPTAVFLSPPIGLITIGVLAFIASIIGCIGAIRERPALIYLYVCMLILVIILQFSFGGAAGALATGSAQEIQAPLQGVLRRNYRLFDWKKLDLFFPPACYAGLTAADTGNVSSHVYHFPLCDFEGCYRGGDSSADEKRCCAADWTCDTTNDQCITGGACLDVFFRKVAGPVATLCFLPVFLQVLSIVFACLIRQGEPIKMDREMDIRF